MFPRDFPFEEFERAGNALGTRLADSGGNLQKTFTVRRAVFVLIYEYLSC